jgi:hypothetical protein
MNTRFVFLNICFYFLASTLGPVAAFAWGGRGHAAICESAVYLVQNNNLKEYLQNKPHMMAHLCNIPDIAWRSLDAQFTKHGNPTHYVNSELIGVSINDTPTDLKSIIEKYTGSKNLMKENSKISSIPFDMGTNWWRADQFYRRATDFATALKKLPAPTNSKEEQDDNLAYNKTFYDMIVSMGLMGHFVGDNSQPFHVTSDYDGYAAGHGGIHAYYEDSSVAYFGPDLQSKIVAQAKKIKPQAKFLKGSNTIEKMRTLGQISADEVKSILKADPVITKSVLKIEKGMSLKTAAVRQPANIGFKKFEKLMLGQMSRSALLLASLWDQAYESAGSPEIKAYKSYRYPLNPEFIIPDYYETKEPEKKTE